MRINFSTRLMSLVYSITPWVAADNYDGVILNIKGCAHLFGGEEGMLDLIARTETFGLTVRGVADTVGGALALARFTSKPTESYLKSNSIDQEAAQPCYKKYK